MCWCLLVVVCAMFMHGVHAHAEVIDLEGTVKAVDASARTITIERTTPKGTKTLELEVTKKAGDLGTVEVGDTISLSYDPDLEVVTKLAPGQQAQQAHGPTAEVNALQELDGAGHEDQPWVILVCTEPNAEKKGMLTIYRRGTPSEPFTYMGIVQVDGKQLPGRFGRYIEATNELYFSRGGKEHLEIAVLRSFDPEQMVKPE